MNEFSHKSSGRGIHPRARRMQRRRVRHPQPHRRHRFGRCGSRAGQDAGRRERIRAVHELHRALANVTRTGDEQLRGEATQIVAEATSRLSGLLAAGR